MARTRTLRASTGPRPNGSCPATFCGGYDHYPDMHPVTWSWEEVGRGIFYHDRKLNDAFLSVVT